MGRFSNLEFQREDEPALPPREEAARDERHYVREALSRFVKGEFESALRYYSRALEFRVEVLEAWLGQVESLLELDQAREADLWSDKGLELFPENPELLAVKAMANARMGAPAKGMELSDRALAAPGTSSLRWRARGEILLGKSDANAEFCFAKAVAAAPADAFLPLAIARAHLRHEKLPTALSYAEKAVDSGGDSAFAWVTLGRCLEKLGRMVRAREAYGRALSIDPRHERARSLANAMDERGPGFVARVLSWFGLRRSAR